MGCPNCFSEINFIIFQVEKSESKTTIKNQENSLKCNHYHEYLASRTKNKPIPDECLVCPKILDCTLKKENF